MGSVNVVSLPLAALAVAVVVIGVGFRALVRGGREEVRLRQAFLIAVLVTALHLLLIWIWVPDMGGLGFFLVLCGALAVLLNLRIDPHDRAQFLLNLACVDLGLSLTWATWIARGDSDVTGGAAMLVGMLFAQIVIVLAACTALLIHLFVALIERRSASNSSSP